MSILRNPVIALSGLCVLAAPAEAHRLKVFATVNDGSVTGYGFFVGGGRPEGATVIFRDAEGRDQHRGVTDKEGRFSWHPDTPMTLTVIIDARDGHVAEATVKSERFSDAASLAVVADAGAAPGVAPERNAAGSSGGCVGAVDRASLASLVDRAAEKAVERQIQPLLESYEAANGAVRFNDIVSGVAAIVGLAGMGMWAASRRRREPGDPG